MYVLSSGSVALLFQRPAAEEHAVWLFRPLDWDGTLDRIHHALYVKCREDMDREASQRASSSIGQSVKSAEKGGEHRSSGYDAGKKSKGRSAISLSIR